MKFQFNNGVEVVMEYSGPHVVVGIFNGTWEESYVTAPIPATNQEFVIGFAVDEDYPASVWEVEYLGLNWPGDDGKMVMKELLDSTVVGGRATNISLRDTGALAEHVEHVWAYLKAERETTDAYEEWVGIGSHFDDLEHEIREREELPAPTPAQAELVAKHLNAMDKIKQEVTVARDNMETARANRDAILSEGRFQII